MLVPDPSTNVVSLAEKRAFSVQSSRLYVHSPSQDLKTEISSLLEISVLRSWHGEQRPSCRVHGIEKTRSSARTFLPLCNDPSLSPQSTTLKLPASPVSNEHQNISPREFGSKDSFIDDISMILRSLPSHMSSESLNSQKIECISKWYPLPEADDTDSEYTEDQMFECTVPVAIIIQVFGFDPRLSPFIVSGYPLLPSMKDNLNSLHLPIVDKKDLQFIQKDDGLFDCVGQGSFGCVFVAEMSARKGKVVVKVYTSDCVTFKMVEHEARILKYLTDTNFVPEFIGLVNSASSNSGYSLVQEYFGEGLTIQKLLNSKNRLTRMTWIRICYQLVVGLACIHTKHILINDIKSDNVLVDLGSGTPEVKYIDMGLASYRRGIQFGEPRPQIHEYRYLAPEVCMGSFTSPLSDIYSLGYLLAQISRKGQISELVSVSEACLVELPVDRISLTDLERKLVHILMEVEMEEIHR